MNNLRKTYEAYRNKLTRKLWGFVSVKAQGKRKGSVLLSYITTPFTLPPWQHKTDPHSNYWECAEIARLFAVRGYDVDIINAGDHRFIPKKPYAACIDVQQGLERLSPYLPKSCKKVIHIDNPYYKIYNEREKKRLEDLRKRRGCVLAPRRQVKESKSIALADFLEGFGNESVFETYKEFKKPIFPIPVSIVEEFDFPEHKNFEEARKHFLYFGGGGAVLKGLDIALEAFAALPHLHLHIVGPSAFEKDFEECYGKELALPNITRYGRPQMDANGHITLGGKDFSEILDRCAAIVYPSAAEGTSTAVVQAIHAGLVPIVTPETGLSRDAGGIVIENPTINSVKGIVEEFSKRSPESIRDEARASWKFVRNHHTRKSFSDAYAAFIDSVLKLS